jgi:hypothetical protein
MANTVNIQVIEDGPKYAVLKVYLASDGASGELTDQVVVDASTLYGAPTDLTLVALWASTTGAAFNLEWDATADVPILNFPADRAEDFCFKKFGGIPNDAGAGKTGDILLNTTGFTAAGDAATLIVHVKKD